MLTESHLQEIADRLKAATPLPWVVRELETMVPGMTQPAVIHETADGATLIVEVCGLISPSAKLAPHARQNLAFIANAGVDISILLEEVRRLKHILEAIHVAVSYKDRFTAPSIPTHPGMGK